MSVVRLLTVTLVLATVLLVGTSLALLSFFTDVPRLVGALVGLGAIAMTGLCFYLLLRGLPGTLTFRDPWLRRLRLSRFAAANGLEYLPQSWSPDIPSSVFSLPGDGTAVATDRLVTAAGRYIDMGNYRRQLGEGTGAATRRWGYLAIELDRQLPHMVLTSRVTRLRNRGIPVSFSRDQVLRLEGDFDRHFTLHAPREYERDALYVFTPDLMALMIDNVTALEVEIIDSWILFYSPVTFTMTSPNTLRRLFRIAGVVGAKTLRQTARYNDDRTGGFAVDAVSLPGRRLRTTVSIVSAVLGGAWIVAHIIQAIVQVTQ